MSATLTRIRDRGFQLEVDDGGLTVYPASRLTTAQRAYFKEHKAAIIKALEVESESRCGSADPHSGVCGDAGRDGRGDGLRAGEPGNKTGTRAGDEATQGRPNSCAPIAGEDRDQALEERRGFMEYDGGPEETLDRREALAAVKRGEVVRIVSATLGESVYWVPDEQTAERLKWEPDYQGEVVYTLTELRKLSGQSPELLRGIHQFKKTFGATLEKENPGENARSRNTVRCGDCQHFQRIDHPHMGKCASGNGRYYLWDTNRRRCKDFLNQAKGDSEQDKGAVIEDPKARLTESERRFLASEQALKIAGAELVEARERIEFLGQVNVKLLEYSRELRMQGLELEASLAMEKAYTRMWTQRTHDPASGLSEPDIRLLLQLCHPDKHNGSAASEKAAQLLLGLREQPPKRVRS